MSDVYLGRFNRAIEKLFNVKGGPTVLDINPSIAVVKALEGPVEERVLGAWQRYGVFAIAPAVAALDSAVRIRNPSFSNVIAVIEQIWASQSVAVTRSILAVHIFNGLSDLSSSLFPLRLDFRQQSGSTIKGSSGTSTVSGPVMAIATSGAGVQFIQTVDQELTMMPGDGYEVQDSTPNEALAVSFVWRERALESSELT